MTRSLTATACRFVVYTTKVVLVAIGIPLVVIGGTIAALGLGLIMVTQMESWYGKAT